MHVSVQNREKVHNQSQIRQPVAWGSVSHLIGRGNGKTVFINLSLILMKLRKRDDIKRDHLKRELLP